MNRKGFYFSCLLTISLTLFVQADNRKVPAVINNTFQYTVTAFKGMGAITSGILAVVLLYTSCNAGYDLFLNIKQLFLYNTEDDLLSDIIRLSKRLFNHLDKDDNKEVINLLRGNIKNSATSVIVSAGLAGAFFYLTYKFGRSCLTDLGLIAKKDPVHSEQKYLCFRKIVECFKNRRGVV
jgi:hypothetical protein